MWDGRGLRRVRRAFGGCVGVLSSLYVRRRGGLLEGFGKMMEEDECGGGSLRRGVNYGAMRVLAGLAMRERDVDTVVGKLWYVSIGAKDSHDS